MASSTSVARAEASNRYHHPLEPYDVQLQFMKAVYDTLEKGGGQVGIFESPTGTGKSLSLICAAVTWLRNHKRGRFEASRAAAAETLAGEPAWVVEQTLRRKREEVRRDWEERERRLDAVRRNEMMEEEEVAAKVKRRRVVEVEKGKPEGEDEEFMLAETRAALKNDDEEEEEDVRGEEVKIYYTSRTHSQLTQFISELRRPAFPPSVPEDVLGGCKGTPKTETVKQVPLSSRQRLCINPSVSRLGTLAAINDGCAELQKPGAKKRCKFLPTAETVKKTHEFRDAVLATVPDIEDMYQKGKQLGLCPYYASRSAMPAAEVVTLPYPLLLQKSAREALGIRLEGNVVIIDEAHNLMDAVASVHAAEIRLCDLRRGRQMLGVYVKRFGKKLKRENRLMVAQTGRVMDALAVWMEEALKDDKTVTGTVDAKALLQSRGADQIDLFDLARQMQESKLAYKVESYASFQSEDDAYPSHASTPVLHTLVSFLLALTNLSSEGRIFSEKTWDGTPDVKLSYLLLSPTHAFSSIASSARAIILAGGTMSPMDDFKTHLFPSAPAEKITTLSCGHVMPTSNLCVLTLASFARGGSNDDDDDDTFEFSFRRRRDGAMIRRLGLALLNMCSMVPDGVVVFFPSYAYLDEVVTAWRAPCGSDASVWDRLEAKKTVFRDVRGESSEHMLQAYSEAILGRKSKTTTTTASGALLLSVVGGKMSEGINFSDALGRCVVIVGLPYPNIMAADWKARIEYVEAVERNRVGVAREQLAKKAGRDFYENACMRAVNQSIGRAIRHRGDYAAVVLIDKRFATPRIRGKLPAWIRAGMVEKSEEGGVAGVMSSLGAFFRGKKP